MVINKIMIFGKKALGVTRRCFSSNLREKMEAVIATRQQEVSAFKKEHSNTVIGEVTIGAVMGGMRGLPGMHYETSKLDA